MNARFAALLVFGASACQGPSLNSQPREDEDGRIVAVPAPVQDDVSPAPEPAPAPAPAAVRLEPVPADATLAPAAAPGTVRFVEKPLREVEGVSSGKVWLLELYQNTLAEKDGLARRLEASERDRSLSQATLVELATARDELATRNTDLEARVRALEAQSLDLARRLADSEIARLEAQKSELKLAAQNDRKERP